MKISLTGTVTIEFDGKVATEAALGPLGRLALAYLVLERQRPVAGDELALALWGEENKPSTWPAALRGVVARLRAFLTASGLGASALTARCGCYQLCLPDDAAVDVETAAVEFEAARIALRHGEARRARQAAGRAAGVCRRQFLAGSSGSWVERRQAELRELHVQSLEILSQAAAACADHAAALRAAEEAVALRPLRESAHLLVIEAHAGAGNRGEALRAYERCRRVLAEELGVCPSAQTEAAYMSLLGEEPQAYSSPGDHREASNLPQSVTNFVGEDRIEQATKLMSFTRLLTLTGPAGVGKSRLGIEVASQLSSDYADGVWLVELAGLAEPAHVPQRVLSVLGLPESPGRHPLESLTRHLAARELLLVLDNCEHLVSSCAALTDVLLRASPRLRILATSREPLRTQGETTWTLPPLSTPGPGRVGPLEALLEYKAVRLFVERATSAAPELELEPVAAAVADICRRLDGLPLAIELAAARSRVLGIPEIARRLDDRFRLLREGPRTAPARHQTLQGALDWSYETLSSLEQEIFARLSVFAGGFTLESAQAVCSTGKGEMVEIIPGLVDKSLVVCERSDGETRYRLLEILRQYGAEKLSPDGEQAALRDRHLQWFATLVDSAEAGLEGQDQGAWLDMLDGEYDNLQACLDWAGSTGACLGVHVAASLWRFWEIRGYLSEGRARLEVLLERSEDCDAALRAKALNAAGVLAQRQSDRRAARRFLEGCLAVRQAQGDRLGTASALHGLANLAVGEGDFATARAVFEENLKIGRELGEQRIVAASLMNLGVALQFLADRGLADPAEAGEQARCSYHESLSLYRALGDRQGVAMALESLAVLLASEGDDEASRSLLQESLRIRRALGDKLGVAASLRFLGHLATRVGDYGLALELHEESLTIERELGNNLQVAADLASLAEIAEHEGKSAEARRLTEERLALLSGSKGSTGPTGRHERTRGAAHLR